MAALSPVASNGSVPYAALVPARDTVIPSHEQICEAFGNRVRNRRYELEISQDGMITALNRIIPEGKWGRTSVSMWENGHSIPDVPVLWALARVLQVTPEWLTFGVVLSGGNRFRTRASSSTGNRARVTTTGKARMKMRHIGRGKYAKVRGT